MTFKARLVIFLLYLLTRTALAQSAFENTLKLYQSEVGQIAQIYSGKQYKGYSFRIENNAHAYFLTSGWHMGNLWYNGLQYVDLSLKFDLVKQKLILKDDYRMIELSSEFIDRFEIEGHNFIRLFGENKDPNLFEVLARKGQKQLLKQHRKTIQEDITRAVEGVKRNIMIQNEYFVYDSNLISVNKKKEVTVVFGQGFSKKAFKANPDQYLVELFKNQSVQ